METPEVVYIAINLDQNEEGEWRWRCMDTSGQSIVPMCERVPRTVISPA